MQFGKVHGPFAEKAYIAYVKLVPLSAEQVADVQADRARKDTRVLQGTIDGMSYFWANEYQTREQIMELIEPYRYSDMGKVIWAVNYGDRTNYETRVGRFWAGPRAVNTTHWVNGYNLGVDGFAVWDIDALSDSPTVWHVLRRTGHRKEIEAAAETEPAPLPTVRLKTVDGFDVLKGGLCAVAYSGG